MVILLLKFTKLIIIIIIICEVPEKLTLEQKKSKIIVVISQCAMSKDFRYVSVRSFFFFCSLLNLVSNVCESPHIDRNYLISGKQCCIIFLIIYFNETRVKR